MTDMVKISTCAKYWSFSAQVLEFFWPSTVRVLGKHVVDSKLQCLFISNDDAYTLNFIRQNSPSFVGFQIRPYKV